MKNELKPVWNRFFDFNWQFGLCLTLMICIPRFFLVLRANASGNYNSIGLVMAISGLVPFVFLSGYGLKKSGLRNLKTTNLY